MIKPGQIKADRKSRVARPFPGRAAHLRRSFTAALKNSLKTHRVTDTVFTRPHRWHCPPWLTGALLGCSLKKGLGTGQVTGAR